MQHSKCVIASLATYATNWYIELINWLILIEWLLNWSIISAIVTWQADCSTKTATWSNGGLQWTSRSSLSERSVSLTSTATTQSLKSTWTSANTMTHFVEEILLLLWSTEFTEKSKFSKIGNSLQLSSVYGIIVDEFRQHYQPFL